MNLSANTSDDPCQLVYLHMQIERPSSRPDVQAKPDDHSRSKVKLQMEFQSRQLHEPFCNIVSIKFQEQLESR